MLSADDARHRSAVGRNHVEIVYDQARSTDGTICVSKKALPEIIKKLGKQLAPRFNHPGLMLKKDATSSSPPAERRQ